MGVVDTFGPGLHNFWTKKLNCGHIVSRISSIKALCLPITGKRHTKGYLQLRAACVSRFSSSKCGFVADSFVTFFTLMELELCSGLAYKSLLIYILNTDFGIAD